MSRTKQEDEKKKPLQTRREKVAALVESINGRLGDDTKSSVADFIRLLEYQREIEIEEQPREMKVTWSEPLETYDTDE